MLSLRGAKTWPGVRRGTGCVGGCCCPRGDTSSGSGRVRRSRGRAGAQQRGRGQQGLWTGTVAPTGPPPPSRILHPASRFRPRPAPVHRAPACPRSPSVRKATATCAHTAGRKTTQRSLWGTALRVPRSRATIWPALLPMLGLGSLWGPPGPPDVMPTSGDSGVGFRCFSRP